MSLNNLLRELSYESGALGALVMTADGVPVGDFRSDDLFDLEGCAEEFAPVLSHVRHVTALLESGGVEELTVRTDRLRVMIATLSEDLALVMVLPGDAGYGRARYLMRRDRGRLLAAAISE